MWPFKKKPKNDYLLSTFDGRQVKYVTKRELLSDGTVKHNIVGKSGRIAVIGDEIRIICGEVDVFKCTVANSILFSITQRFITLKKAN